MCGRFTLTAPGQVLADLFRLTEVPTLEPRYNIAPTQPVAAVRSAPGGAGRELVWLRWGLTSPWALAPGSGSGLINARAETAADKPAFRRSLRQRRCLVPADGFYEWQALPGRKQPFHFRMCDGRPFAIAGLWEQWQGPDGKAVASCALLTTQANELVRPVHDRMPVILPPAAWDLWLDPRAQDPAALRPWLAPYFAEEMSACPVSTRVNNPRNEGPPAAEWGADKQGWGGLARI
jgi:putative SOS response-associated peptidase YedK